MNEADAGRGPRALGRLAGSTPAVTLSSVLGTVLVCHPNRLEPNLRTGLDQTSSETPGGIREPSSRVRAVSQPEDETAGA